MEQQIHMAPERVGTLWRRMITRKIENQARALTLLGLGGAEEVLSYIALIDEVGIDAAEAGAARVYFQYYHPGLNRRDDDPMNSCLNYGYSIIRNTLSRTLIANGFLLAWGLHHRSRFNAYNLSDDLIEPFRPMVDICAHSVVRANLELTRAQRRELAQVLYHTCRVGDKKVSATAAIDLVVEDIRRYIAGETEIVHLPVALPVETMEAVTE